MKGKARVVRRELLKEIRDQHKKTHCLDCKKQYPYQIMQFDHRIPADKKAEIGVLITRAVEVKTFIRELEKCDVVCPTCHALREHKRSLKQV